MDEKKLKALAVELAKGLKTEADLNSFSRMLAKLTVETVLNAELADHPGYEKNAPKTGSNTRNGYSSKTVLCDDGEIELTHRVTVKTPSNHSCLRSTRRALRRWTAKFYPSTPKA